MGGLMPADSRAWRWASVQGGKEVFRRHAQDVMGQVTQRHRVPAGQPVIRPQPDQERLGAEHLIRHPFRSGESGRR